MSFPGSAHDFKKLLKNQPLSFQELLEQNAAFSFEKQLLFGEVIGSNAWNFDMKKGEITFGAGLHFPVQIIGSIAFAQSSWMWGWANSQSGIPENLLAQSNLMKAFGENHHIQELTEPVQNVDGRFDHLVGMVACGIFGSSCYYSANYGKGSLIITISDPKIPADGTKDLMRLPGFFTQMISQVEVNHKNAFVNYLIDKNFLVDEKDNLVHGMKDNFLIKAEFDSLHRLTDLSAQ